MEKFTTMTKKKEKITIDDTGKIATIKINLSSEDREKLATILISEAAKAIIKKTGVELDGLINATVVRNKKGKATAGVWQFKIGQKKKAEGGAA